jgi:hypothetical protein
MRNKLKKEKNNKMALLKGKAFWAKIVGGPQLAFDKVTKEWSVDVSLDAEGVKQAADLGISSKVKNKGDDRGNFITFKRREKKTDGTPNQAIRIYDHHGQPWKGGLIGNGSEVNVKFNVYEGRNGKRPVILALQVWNHVPYEGPAMDSDFPTREDADVPGFENEGGAVVDDEEDDETA